MLLRRSIFLLALASMPLAGAEPMSPRVAERYRQMLTANPEDGVAVERLWKAAVEQGTTEKLLTEFAAGKTFASEMASGFFLLRAARDADARAAFERAGKRDPSSPTPLLALAKLHNTAARPDEAAAAIEKAVALLPPADPRMNDALMQLGAAWHAAGDLKKATTAWERTIERHPADLALRRRLAEAYAASYLYNDAIRHLQFISENAPPADRATALQQAGRLHSAAGRPAEALAALEKALALTAPTNWLRTELLGQMIRLTQRQRGEAALEAKWRQAADANPRDLGAALAMVEFYEKTGALTSQQDWLKKASALAPKNRELRIRLARVAVALDELDSAGEQFDTLIREQPADVDLAFERARLDLRRENATAARERITALVATRQDDETLRAKALEFYRENRLLDLAEAAMKTEPGEDGVIALAGFYFAQQRDADALTTLRRLIRPSDPPATRAAAHAKIAQVLKTQGEIAAAADQARFAADLAPQSREFQTLVGDIFLAAQRGKDARPSLEKAWELATTDAERIESDEKLFESFRAQSPGPDEDPELNVLNANREVENYIRGLMDLAREKPTAAAWLRVARWKAWNGDKGGAVTYANKAADIEPHNPQPLEFLAAHATRHGDHLSAANTLQRLAALNPAGRDGYLRQLGHLEMNSGDVREAVRIFADLAARNPGSPDALADLATAQDRAALVVESLATWRRAHSVAPPLRKREFAASILTALRRQEKHAEAAEWMLNLADATADEKERMGRFDELLLFAQQYGRLPWLRTKLEERRRLRADDYFTAVALGRVLKALGEKEAAFELFADAALSAPNQADALPALVREAEELRRLDTAVRLQEQLTRVAPQDRPDGLLKLALLHEKTGDIPGAERAWNRATTNSPRDFDVLRRAADFHFAWGDRARAVALLRKLVALEPSYIRGAVELGTMELFDGRANEAAAAFAHALKLTKPLPELRLFPTHTTDSLWAERVLFDRIRESSAAAISDATSARPVWMMNELRAIAPSGIRPAVFGTRRREPGQPSGAALARLPADFEWRIAAITGAAKTARSLGGTALETWRQDWSSAAQATPNEAAWALFYAGEHAAALDVVFALVAAEPQALPPAQAFIAMAIETRQFSRLAAWLAEEMRTPAQREAFMNAFGECLRRSPETMTSDAIAQLFPAATEPRPWQAGIDLARARKLEDAIALGTRALANSNDRVAWKRRELARWHFGLGNVNDARQLIASAATETPDSFEHDALHALRELHLLTPPAARPQWRKEQLAKLTNSLPDQLRRVVLLGLDGDKRRAVAALELIYGSLPLPGRAGRANVEHRRWAMLAGAAGQFAEWDMPWLGAELWSLALTDGSLAAIASDMRQRDHIGGNRSRPEIWAAGDAVRDIVASGTSQLAALRYLAGSAVERATIRRSLERTGSSDPDERIGPLMDFADSLKVLGAWPGVVEVYRHAWEMLPAYPRTLRELLDACRVAGDEETAERVRSEVTARWMNPGSDAMMLSFALDQADALERRGAVEEAGKLLDRALNYAPGDAGLLRRKALIFQRAGRHEEADEILIRIAAQEGGTAVGRVQLATLLEQQGQSELALNVRVKSGGIDDRVPALLARTDRGDEAALALERLAGPRSVEAAVSLAEEFALRGDLRGAHGVLLHAAARVQEPGAQFRIRAAFLTLPGPSPTAATVTRVQERLRALALPRRELEVAYYDFFETHAARLGVRAEWENERDAAWATNNAAAGLAVLGSQLAAQSAAAQQTIAKLITIGNEPILLLAADRIERNGMDALRLPLVARNFRRSIPNAPPLAEYAGLLDKLGRREEARKVVDEFGWIGIFPGQSAALGMMWLDLGDPTRAREFFIAAMQDRPLSPRAGALGGMARAQAALGNHAAAMALLRQAFGEVGCREFEALTTCLAAANRLGDWRSVASELGLGAGQLHGLKLAIFAHHERLRHTVDAFLFAEAMPEIISPTGDGTFSTAPGASVTAARLRALALSTGAFDECAKAMMALMQSGAPDIGPELALLHADRAAARGDSASAKPHVARAAAIRPGHWESARRAAATEPENAKKILAAFLSLTPSGPSRDAAIRAWSDAR